MTKLIDSPSTVGIDPDDIRANPGAIVDIHEDVLRDLMTTPHAIQRSVGATGSSGHMSGVHKPRRRTCI